MNKSYTPFSLTTLQLPAPSSNLTKAEYKETYGIDLDDVNIPSFKLVVYGKDKFPIDQIKAVEGGYEIYFNGRVLSITDIVQTSGEVYAVENSKPIYCHPITIYFHGSDNYYKFAMLIFNNSSDALNTGAKLKNYLLSFNGRVLVSGAIKTNTYYMAVSFIVNSNNVLYLCGIDDQGGIHDNDNNPVLINDIIYDDQVVSDLVNKIN